MRTTFEIIKKMLHLQHLKHQAGIRLPFMSQNLNTVSSNRCTYNKKIMQMSLFFLPCSKNIKFETYAGENKKNWLT